ncbi:MAG: hypothetical protein IPM79_13790 [Polyangiaceae bacterium]|nr:hypothetical protein [Polyangiaceae bacterium]MBK8938668.1 hypothetical protein [Polyangiaceae bacterium]
MLLARHALPEIPALAAADKYAPAAVALPFGDAVLAIFGAHTQPMTVARFAPGSAPLVREYPAADPDALFDEAAPREKAGDFDASSDVYSRVPASRPLQLVAVAGVPWLVRAAGHARVDPESLDVIPAARSRVRWLLALLGDAILAGSGAEYSSSDAFQRFTRGPRALLDGPIFRTRTGLTRNSDWIVEGETFPVGNPATAFTDGVGKLRPSGASSVHAFSAALLGSEVIVYGREIHRSGSSRPALITIDLERAEVTRHVPVQHEDPFRVAVAGGALLGLGAKSIVRIDPVSLTIIDSADLPAGVRLLGHDETRVVVLHKRSKTLLVFDAAPFAGALDAAMGGMVTALAAKPEKARKKG